jgi:hypothetical protein
MESRLEIFSKVPLFTDNGKFATDSNESSLISKTIKTHALRKDIDIWVLSSENEINSWGDLLSNLQSSREKALTILKDFDALIPKAKLRNISVKTQEQLSTDLQQKISQLSEQLAPLIIENEQSIGNEIMQVIRKAEKEKNLLENRLGQVDRYHSLWKSITKKISDFNQFLKSSRKLVKWEISGGRLKEINDEVRTKLKNPDLDNIQPYLDDLVKNASSILEELQDAETTAKAIYKQAKDILEIKKRIKEYYESDAFTQLKQQAQKVSTFHSKNWEDALDAGSFPDKLAKIEKALSMFSLNLPLKEEKVGEVWASLTKLEKELNAIKALSKKIDVKLTSIFEQREQYTQYLIQVEKTLAEHFKQLNTIKENGDEELVLHLKKSEALLHSIKLLFRQKWRN